MMRESLKIAAKSPLFQITMSTGINNLLAAAKLLSSIGVDVNDFIADALKSINDQLTDAAYDATDLDELLKQAQSIGDEVVETIQEETTGNARPETEKSDDSDTGSFG